MREVNYFQDIQKQRIYINHQKYLAVTTNYL